MEIMFVRDGLPGTKKQPTIVKKEGNKITPVVIFQKAKGAKQEDYESVIKFLINQAEKTINR